MALYHYVAVSSRAGSVTGRMEAASKAAVVERLHEAGHVPINIAEVGRLWHADLGRLFQRRRVSARSLAVLTSQLATLLDAGVVLDECLAILEEMTEAPREREVLRGLLDRVRAGASLSEAMAAERTVFPDFYVSMVRAGEAGASLEAVLARLSEFLDRSQAIREHVKSALLYPLIVGVTCLLSISMLFIFVVPRFKPLFEQAGSALPLTAQALLWVSDFMQDYWWVLVVVPLLAIVIVRLQLRKPAVRARLDRRLLKLPLVGALIAKVQTVRFARTLGTALKNGVSLETALAITRETLSNQVFADAAAMILERVKTGTGLATPVVQAKVFPVLAGHLIRVGEEVGRQDDMLVKIADIFELETRRALDRLLALLAPALTIVLGVVVAGVTLSIITAVLSVYDLAM
jgi:general secretion pathway protein F